MYFCRMLGTGDITPYHIPPPKKGDRKITIPTCVCRDLFSEMKIHHLKTQ